MRDIAYNREIRSSAENETVTGVSLMRDIPKSLIYGQLDRLARGGARLTAYDFRYTVHGKGITKDFTIEFHVEPDSSPPSNIHVLIGRNGVGKSTLLNQMAKTLVNQDPFEQGQFYDGESLVFDQFANLVSVSFSAFDEFEPISVSRDRRNFGYHYVGLKKIASSDGSLKDLAALRGEFTKALNRCIMGAKRPRLERALHLLESDPMFSHAGIYQAVLGLDETNAAIEEISDEFGYLSSGHKIVLLSITRLIEAVEEKSLVLIDEPESHLHPPLLSAYMRALSDLLIDRNGVAVVATHSPVVLQEVPQACVSKIGRVGDKWFSEAPEIQTFGENVGTLTNEVFSLEVTATGFHRMLTEAALETQDYADALQLFGGQLGSEAKALLRARVLQTIRER